MRTRAYAIAFAMLIASMVGDADAKIARSKKAIAEFKRIEPCPANANRYGPCPGWQIDHRVPLKCKGADTPSNMQWLTVADHKRKTAKESRLCRR